MIIVCLMQGGMEIVEYVEKMGKVRFDSCTVTLANTCFWGARGRNGNFMILLTGIWVL